MIKPAHAEVEAVHVMRLACNCNSFLHSRDGFTETLKVCLYDCQIQERKLIGASVEIVVHGVVKVSVEIVKGRGVVACSPGVEISRKSEHDARNEKLDCALTPDST